MNCLARGPRPCVSSLCRCLENSTVRQQRKQQQQQFQVQVPALATVSLARKNNCNSNKKKISNTGCSTTLKSTFLGTIGSTLGPHSAAARSFASAWSQWDVTRRTLATTRIRWVVLLLVLVVTPILHPPYLLPLISVIRAVIILLSFVAVGLALKWAISQVATTLYRVCR